MTSPSTKATRRSSTSATPPAASGRPSTTARRGRPSSTNIPSLRSATSSWRRRIPASSTSAPANRTTARAPRSAPASTSPPTADASSSTSGLKETQTIAKVVAHPKDPNIVYVAAAGHLFGPNPERGVYKTTDGGKTWTNTKFIDNDTGFIDLVMHPTNPNTLFAASYQRRRQPWGFNGGGPGSGIWRTDDGGKTWTRVTGNGLPANPIIGRIGLNYSRSKPTVIYAQLEVGPSGGTGAGVNEDGTLVQPGQGRGGGGGAGGGRGGQPPPPPDPTKSGVWRSDDGGKSWKFMSNNNNRPMYYSKIRVDPTNPDIVYTTGASAYKSIDGGKTFTHDGLRSATAITMRSGSIRATASISSSATTAASTSATTRARRGRRSASRRSASSTRSASTCGSRITSAAACRTTARGADRAPCAAT